MFDDPDSPKAFFGEPLGCRAASAAERPVTQSELVAVAPVLLRIAPVLLRIAPVLLRIASALRFPVNRIQACSRRRYGDV